MPAYTYTGGVGNDALFALRDVTINYVNGGAGVDTLWIDRMSQANYTVSGPDASGVTTLSGASGSKFYLSDVERVSFNGVYWSVPAPVDTTVPTVSAFSPIDAATGVALASDIVITFSEAIQRGAGSIVLKNAAGTVIETLDAATNSNLSISGATLTINPTANLAYGTNYFVNFASGNIKDLAGNAYAGITTYGFTTMADPLAGVAGNNTINGLAGNNNLNNGLGDDDENGENGDDGENDDDGENVFDDGVDDDHLDGGSGDGTRSGGDGDDIFDGGVGDDCFDGGSGDDTATYSGSRASFNLTKSGNNYIVNDITGINGTDTLINIERISFADGTLAFDTNGNAGEIYRLYRAAFDRVPDTPGLGHNIRLVDAGLTLGQMSSAFVQSAEFMNTYESLSDEQFITHLYQNVLHRAPDQPGLAHNLNLLNTSLTRADMLAAYSESAENQAAVIGQIQDGIWFT